MGFLCIDLDFTTFIPQLYTTRSSPLTYMFMNSMHEHPKACKDQATLPSTQLLDVQRSKQTRTTSYLFLFAHIGPCNTLLKPRLAIGSLLDHKLKAARSTLVRVIVHGICNSMDNIIAIGVGLALRAVIDKLTDNDYRLTGAFCYKLIWPI